MHTQKTWVLVANGSLARIFNLSKDTLAEIEVLTHPETRVHGHDLVSDSPGLSYASSGSGRHAMEPKISPQKNEMEHFAKQIAHYLDLEHRKNHFHYLHILAAPTFLGLIRHNLGHDTKNAILQELDKDLTQESPLQIRSYLSTK